MEETYLVTGSDGHLGSWVVKQLIKKGKIVRGLRLNTSHYKTPIIEKVYYGDVRDINSMEAFFDVKKAKVIHTAGIINVTTKMTKALYDVNVQGSINVLNLCKRHNFPLTYISSVHAFVNDKEIIDEKSTIDSNKVIGPYAITKAITTQIMIKERKNLNINIVFPSGILGPEDYGSNHLNSVIKDRLSGKLFAYTDGGYDMVDVRDVSNFIACLVTSETENENFIISNTFISVKEFLEKIGEIIKDNKKLIKIPKNIASLLAPLSEAYYKILKKPALFCSYSIYTLNNCPIFSHDKASLSFNYSPRAIETSISDIIKEFKNKNI